MLCCPHPVLSSWVPALLQLVFLLCMFCLRSVHEQRDTGKNPTFVTVFGFLWICCEQQWLKFSMLKCVKHSDYQRGFWLGWTSFPVVYPGMPAVMMLHVPLKSEYLYSWNHKFKIEITVLLVKIQPCFQPWSVGHLSLLSLGVHNPSYYRLSYMYYSFRVKVPL